MAKSYAQIVRQIQALEKQAADLRRKEQGGVIARIKEAIAHYGITAEELGLAPSSSKRRGARAAGNGRAAGRAAGVVKYRDDAGHTWTGHGKRPNWFKEALAAGKTLEQLSA
ncbi:MAG TPA: H-NS histone family protein [Burkholderiaceae bacterium]|jgi:DNA-binding protein H-NS|nr:H-NS histone family protein [Burkholderiaceae bacterium]